MMKLRDLACTNKCVWGFLLCFAGLAFSVPAVCADSDDVLLPNKLPAIAEKALKSPESVVLYSLEPYTESPEADRHWKGSTFHGYMCLGKVSLTGNAARTAILEFKTAVPTKQQPMAMCFDPRHALSIVYKEHTFDLLLCFQCQQMRVYKDGEELAVVGVSGSADVLNKLLKKLNIPLSYIFNDAEIKKRKE